MICQECDEEYQFEGFRLDNENCRVFATFKCECQTKLVLPEEDCIRLGLLDDDAREQLRHLRLIGIRVQLDRAKSPQMVWMAALKASQPVLLKYLEDFANPD